MDRKKIDEQLAEKHREWEEFEARSAQIRVERAELEALMAPVREWMKRCLPENHPARQPGMRVAIGIEPDGWFHDVGPRQGLMLDIGKEKVDADLLWSSDGIYRPVLFMGERCKLCREIQGHRLDCGVLGIQEHSQAEA